MLFGPIVKTIESIVYQLPEVIKHTTWTERPAFMRALFGSQMFYSVNDFTSFEASIRRALSHATEGVTYNKMVPGLGDWLTSAFFSKNTLEFSFFTIIMSDPCRSSGDVTTSLGNLLVNYWTNRYVHEVMNCVPKHMYDSALEGDDNMTGSHLPIKASAEQYAKLGLISKLEFPTNPFEASFCGMIFSEEDDCIITDPYKVLDSIGWIPDRYVNARDNKLLSLYRARALSYLYQYRGCPIIDSLCRWILKRTEHVLPDWNILDFYKDELIPRDIRNIPFVPITINRRILVEKIFTITVEVQYKYENWFDANPCFGDIPNFIEGPRDDYHITHVSSNPNHDTGDWEFPVIEPLEWAVRVNRLVNAGVATFDLLDPPSLN